MTAACAPPASTHVPVSTPSGSPFTVTVPAPGAPIRTTPLAAASSTAPTASSLAATEIPTVQVAVLGNVYIRRGPDLGFNPVASLARGDVVTANGRDVLSKWLRIPLPADASQQGWISIMSDFTRVTGDVRSLPEIEPQSVARRGVRPQLHLP